MFYMGYTIIRYKAQTEQKHHAEQEHCCKKWSDHGYLFLVPICKDQSKH
jgi:hypothetical protein